MPLAESNGFHWVNDPSNICDQSNHGTAIGHNNIVVKRNTNENENVNGNKKNKKTKKKPLIGDMSFRLHF